MAYAPAPCRRPAIPKGGRIIVFSSFNADRRPYEGFAANGATKAAFTAQVKGWAGDLGSRQILVNAIQPDSIDTDMDPAAGPFVEPVSGMTAMKRYGKPEEIAILATFLASDQSSFIAGSAINVDGGISL